MKAYIIARDSNSTRCRNTSHLLNSLGIDNEAIVLPWDDPEFVETLPAVPGTVDTEHKYGALSCALAQRRAWSRIAGDDSLASNDWSLVFEDDIALHPYIEPSSTVSLIQDLLGAADDRGFIYLGVCAPEETAPRKTPAGTPGIETVLGAGMCTHAYAVQKSRAASLYDDVCLYTGVAVATPLDVYLRHFWLGQGGAPIAGVNLQSPDQPDHFGLFFQDRDEFPSILLKWENRRNYTGAAAVNPLFSLQRCDDSWQLSGSNGSCHLLSDSAAVIWRLCEQGLTLHDMEKTLRAHFPEAPELYDNIYETLQEFERLDAISFNTG